MFQMIFTTILAFEFPGRCCKAMGKFYSIRPFFSNLDVCVGWILFIFYASFGSEAEEICFCARKTIGFENVLVRFLDMVTDNKYYVIFHWHGLFGVRDSANSAIYRRNQWAVC